MDVESRGSFFFKKETEPQTGIIKLELFAPNVRNCSVFLATARLFLLARNQSAI